MEADINKLVSECENAVERDNTLDLCVSQHISQLLELDDIDTTIFLHKRYWSPIYEEIKKVLFQKNDSNQ